MRPFDPKVRWMEFQDKYLFLDSLGQCLHEGFPVDGHHIQLCEICTRGILVFSNFLYSLHFSDASPCASPYCFLLRTLLFTGLNL